MLLKSIFSILCILHGTHSVSDKKNFYSYKVKDIDEKEVSLGIYKGKVSLVVNVASECGFTEDGYKMMKRLQTKFGPTGYFNVLAFPSNQFGAQEPGDNASIKKFAKTEFGANFPMFAKINVNTDQSAEAPDAWKYLKKAAIDPNWNFWKYLIDHNGDLIEYYDSFTPYEQLEVKVRRAISKAMVTSNSKVHSDL